jgi:hypothetical protein
MGRIQQDQQVKYQITPIYFKIGSVDMNSFALDTSLDSIELNMNSQKKGIEGLS